MNLIKIAWKNIASKPLNTFLSLVLLAFGVGIISLLLILETRLQEQFDRNIKDIDMVLGAKGSPLQLILANVYHIDAPTGNINRKEAEKIVKHPFIEEGIPLAYGDNYKMFRIVGTTHQYHEHYGVELAEGALFEGIYNTTIGSKVAEELGLKIGDEFYSAHGLKDDADVHTNKTFKVAGIFKESKSVIDQLILTEMASIWGVHEQVGEETGEDPSEEITAVLLKKKNPLALVMLPSLLKESNMQIALPAIEINRLTQNFGIGMGTLRAIAILIMILSFVSVFISLYNSMRERKYELALMRSMGASRSTLFKLILFEGLLMTAVGIFIGLLFSRIGMLILSWKMQDQFNYDVTNFGILHMEWLLVGITIFVGVLASLLPAITAVRLDISKILADG